MYRATGIGAGSQSYTRDSSVPDTLTSVPLLIDGSFEVQSQWASSSATPLAESRLYVKGSGRLLGGSFCHHLGSPLRDWAVIYGNRIYRPLDDTRKSLPAGRFWEFSRGGSQITHLKAYLTSDRPARQEPQKTTPGQSAGNRAYSSAGRDPLDIVTVMSLYDVAGADAYIGLSNDTLNRLDMSESIRLNYALIIGWTEEPATQLEIDGRLIPEANTESIVRLLLPVDRQPAGREAMTEEEIRRLREARSEEAPSSQTDSTPPTESSAGQDETGPNQESSRD